MSSDWDEVGNGAAAEAASRTGASAGSADSAAGDPATGAARAGFCQHCGRPLTAETIRKVGHAVYCEPCLAARLSGRPVGPEVPPVYGSDEWFVNRGSSPGPNPGLAALLGLIPGVGAMYNEQYAKGLVHLVVFAILASMGDHVSGIFGLLAFGWVLYMAIEAHHTARARRDGTPLPNPFGLNDIGERMGFGRAWPQGPTVVEVAQDAAAAAAAAANQAAAGYPPPPQPGQAPAQPFQPQPAGQWGAPADAFAEQMARDIKIQAARGVQAPMYGDMRYAQAPPVTAGFAGVPPVGVPYEAAQYTAPYGAAYEGTARYGASPIPPVGAYGSFDSPLMAQRARRFPAGAAWLIGLGCVFLLATTGIFANVNPEAMVGFVVLGFGVWLFVSRMVDSGSTMLHDGSAGYPLRILRALRVSVWLDLIGTLFVLDGFGILSWRHSWPLLVILAGVMPLVERAMVQSVANGYVPMPVAPMPGSPMPGAQKAPAAAPAANEPHEGGQ